MNSKIGTCVKLVKIGETEQSKLLPEKYPIGHIVEGILVGDIEEGNPIKIVHLKNEMNRQYGIFNSTNLVTYDVSEKVWTLTTKNSIYSIEQIETPFDDSEE